MLKQFDEAVVAKGYPWKLRDILLKVFLAGEQAGDSPKLIKGTLKIEQ